MMGLHLVDWVMEHQRCQGVYSPELCMRLSVCCALVPRRVLQALSSQA